jgi:4-hydroxyproline epimerase
MNAPAEAESVYVIDSHTGGEPTRVVIAGGPDLGNGPLPERVARFERDFDHFRRLLIDEPRGNDAMVGALLCEPTSQANKAAHAVSASCVAGVIFFNNRGYLGMCGHGTIGVAATLAYLKRITPGIHLLETPVGVVSFDLLDANRVAIENVPSYRLHTGVRLDVAGLGAMTGDVAWGGNWFFLAQTTSFPLVAENIDRLTDAALRVRKELARQGICGADGAEIDHIEFFGPAKSPEANSRNFVLCPGGAYDRSPCGTGTSAKLACLAADKKLAPGEPWVQESIIGSRFSAHYRIDAQGRILPTIQGAAYVYAESRFVSQPGDPFRYGIRAE